jgi:hypothetical protein
MAEGQSDELESVYLTLDHVLELSGLIVGGTASQARRWRARCSTVLVGMCRSAATSPGVITSAAVKGRRTDEPESVAIMPTPWPRDARVQRLPRRGGLEGAKVQPPKGACTLHLLLRRSASKLSLCTACTFA